MSTAPKSLDEEIAEHRRIYGGTEEEAASVVVPRRARAAEARESTDPAVLLPAIRDRLGLAAKIERIVKTVSTPAHYRMETNAGPVILGPANRWATRPAEFKAAFLDVCEMPDLPKGPARDELCAMIARAAEPEDVGDDATDAGWTQAMLRDYLEQRPPASDVTDAAASEYPFIDTDGRTTLFAPAFRRWLRLTHMENLTPGDCGRRLRAVGCEPGKVNTGTGPDRTTRSVWRLPAGVTE